MWGKRFDLRRARTHWPGLALACNGGNGKQSIGQDCIGQCALEQSALETCALETFALDAKMQQ